MVQTVIVYAIVACATLWVVWRVLLPASLRNAVRRRIAPHSAGASASGCHDGCSTCAMRTFPRRTDAAEKAGRETAGTDSDEPRCIRR